MLMGIQSKEAGWRIALPGKEAPGFVEFTRAGDWRWQEGKYEKSGEDGQLWRRGKAEGQQLS